MISQLDFRLGSLHPRLSDWTGVGYRGGENPPVVLCANVIEYGPGTHAIDHQLVLQSGQVLRGAGKDHTILRFTKSLYQLFGKGPWQAGSDPNTPGWSSGGGLIKTAYGVSEVGIEDLTIEFPAHTQKAHHYEVGYNALFLDAPVNCWIRRVRIVNADSGVLGYRLTNCLIDDLELTWPNVTKNGAGYVAHYGVMFGRDSTLSLVDNLHCQGLCRHDTDVANGAHHNVFMRSTFVNYVCSHHGGTKDGQPYGPHHNLFTDIDCGLGTRVFTDSGGSLSAMPHNGPGAVFWGLHKSDGTPISVLPPFTGTRYWRKDVAIVEHTLNRLNTDLTKEWVEGIHPDQRNVYLAQRGDIAPPIPPEPEPPSPPAPAPPPEPPEAPMLTLGDYVEATASLVIRSGPSKAAPQVGSESAGARGYLVEGPILDSVSGFTYWRVPEYEGWVGQDKLKQVVVDPKFTAKQKLQSLGLTAQEADVLINP